jgi:hypothetical protein
MPYEQVEGDPVPDQRVPGRTRFMDAQRVNLDGFAAPDPRLGLVAMATSDIDFARLLVDPGTPRAEVIRVAGGATPAKLGGGAAWRVHHPGHAARCPGRRLRGGHRRRHHSQRRGRGSGRG